MVFALYTNSYLLVFVLILWKIVCSVNSLWSYVINSINWWMDKIPNGIRLGISSAKSSCVIWKQKILHTLCKDVKILSFEIKEMYVFEVTLHFNVQLK